MYHHILSGTSGAVSLALFVRYWTINRKFSIVGICACMAIVIASNSSGPIAATIFSGGLLFAWRWREYLKHAKKTALFLIFALSLYMERPFYYIVDSIDFTGGSTGWHRARLIESALDKIGEWWLFGTDYTRHWMPTGVSWNPNHTDITNYYLHLGVIGGLPLTLCLIAIVWVSGKKLINLALSLYYIGEKRAAFANWTLFSVLIAHAASFVSISYFDQMFVLFFILVALIANAKYPEEHRDGEQSNDVQIDEAQSARS